MVRRGTAADRGQPTTAGDRSGQATAPARSRYVLGIALVLVTSACAGIAEGSGGLLEPVSQIAPSRPAATTEVTALSPLSELSAQSALSVLPTLSPNSAFSAPTRPPDAALARTPASQTYPFVPTTLTLPSGAVAPVEPAEVDAAQALLVPADPARVGWWTGGARVGEPFGNVVLAGHVDTRAFGLGVMVELFDTTIGAKVLAGDGAQQRAYRVISVDSVPKARLDADLQVFRQDVDHRLVLITCGGEYDPVSRSYADNVVVVAVPVG